MAFFGLDRKKRAEQLYAEGKREKAAELFAKLGDLERAGKIALELRDETLAVRYLTAAALGAAAGVYEDSTAAEAAGALAAAGHHQAALELYELAGEYRKAADCAIQTRRWDRAARDYERAREPELAALYYERCGRLRDAERLLGTAGRALAESAAAGQPGALEQQKQLSIRRVKLLQRIGERERAREILERWRAETLEEAKLLVEVSSLPAAVDRLIECDNPDLARLLLESTGKQDPELLARIHRAAGRTAEAAAVLQNAGRSRDAARALEQTGRWAEAAKLWEAEREPARAAEAYEKAELTRDAARCWEAAREPARAAAAYATLGDLTAAARLFALADQRYQSAIHSLRAGDRDAAIRVLERVQNKDSDYRPATLLHARLLLEPEAGAPSVATAQRALSLLQAVPESSRLADRNAADWFFWEGRALELAEQPYEAGPRYARAIELDERHTEAREALERLVRTGKTPPRIRVPAAGGASPEGAAGAADDPTRRLEPDLVATRGDEAATPAGSGSALAVGSLLAGRYELRRELGRGGMGCVYQAWDRELNDFVALKTVLAGQDESKERLLQEVRICRRLTHPNIVRVYDVGRTEEGLFLTMELLAGRTLDAILLVEPTPPLERVRSILRQVAVGLGEAHRHGVIHRDLKPGNIMVGSDPDETVKILDFGIARAHGLELDLTQTGTAVGSPMYMSPEQLRQEELDGRSDLYALGVVAFTMLAGQEPFRGEHVAAIVTGHLHQEPPSLGAIRPQLPFAWGSLVQRLLAKSRDERPRRAEDVVALIDALPD